MEVKLDNKNRLERLIRHTNREHKLLMMVFVAVIAIVVLVNNYSMLGLICTAIFGITLCIGIYRFDKKNTPNSVLLPHTSAWLIIIYLLNIFPAAKASVTSFVDAIKNNTFNENSYIGYLFLAISLISIIGGKFIFGMLISLLGNVLLVFMGFRNYGEMEWLKYLILWIFCALIWLLFVEISHSAMTYRYDDFAYKNNKVYSVLYVIFSILFAMIIKEENDKITWTFIQEIINEIYSWPILVCVLVLFFTFMKNALLFVHNRHSGIQSTELKKDRDWDQYVLEKMIPFDCYVGIGLCLMYFIGGLINKHYFTGNISLLLIFMALFIVNLKRTIDWNTFDKSLAKVILYFLNIVCIDLLLSSGKYLFLVCSLLLEILIFKSVKKNVDFYVSIQGDVDKSLSIKELNTQGINKYFERKQTWVFLSFVVILETVAWLCSTGCNTDLSNEVFKYICVGLPNICAVTVALIGFIFTVVIYNLLYIYNPNGYSANVLLKWGMLVLLVTLCLVVVKKQENIHYIEDKGLAECINIYVSDKENINIKEFFTSQVFADQFKYDYEVSLIQKDGKATGYIKGVYKSDTNERYHFIIENKDESTDYIVYWKPKFLMNIFNGVNEY